MPKNAINYSKCVIYKICCKDPTITYEYYGHTTNQINRKRQHKNRCNDDKYNTQSIYKTIRENGNWENWDFIVIEEYPCENVNEARLRERYWIELNRPQLNVYIPSRTFEEYTETNKEKIKEKALQYYYENIEEIKKIREENKEEINEKKKKYYEENKEEILSKQRQHRIEHKEEISQQRNQKIICECGCKISKSYLVEHRKSQKHINLMKNKESI